MCSGQINRCVILLMLDPFPAAVVARGLMYAVVCCYTSYLLRESHTTQRLRQRLSHHSLASKSVKKLETNIRCWTFTSQESYTITSAIYLALNDIHQYQITSTALWLKALNNMGHKLILLKHCLRIVKLMPLDKWFNPTSVMITNDQDMHTSYLLMA